MYLNIIDKKYDEEYKLKLMIDSFKCKHVDVLTE